MLGHHDDIVFVYGAMRSGTTVFRLMLDAHPQIGNPGEMDFLFDFLHPDSSHETGWRYDFDALHGSRIFREAGLDQPEGLTGLDLLDSFLTQLKARTGTDVISINLHNQISKTLQIMPKARVLHVVRDPRDVARSSIQMGWAGTLYHSVQHWVDTERDWDKAKAQISPEQAHDLTYEDLFRDIDSELRKVTEFFGVPFDPNMLGYHENTTYGPPDVSLTEQWKRKCTAPELEEIESRIVELMQSRGYAPSQPQTALSGLRKLKLAVQNKRYIWAFGMKRFGAFTFWAERVTRWAGLKTAHQVYRRRIQDIIGQEVK